MAQVAALVTDFAERRCEAVADAAGAMREPLRRGQGAMQTAFAGLQTHVDSAVAELQVLGSSS